ncbi:unknown [Clostridium sp. CAG:169]|nr:unknown [Clostridium sp. CAG:169]
MRLVNGALVVDQVVFCHCNAGIAAGQAVLHLRNLLTTGINPHRQLLDLLKTLLQTVLLFGKQRLDVGKLVLLQKHLLLFFFQPLAGVLHRVGPQRDFQCLFLLGQLQKTLCLLRLLPQRLQTVLQFCHDVL